MFDPFYDFGLNPIVHVGFLESKSTKRIASRVRQRHKKKTFDGKNLQSVYSTPKLGESHPSRSILVGDQVHTWRVNILKTQVVVR